MSAPLTNCQFFCLQSVSNLKFLNLIRIVYHHLHNSSLNSQLLEKHFELMSMKVKIVYHPDFIDSSNPLFGLDYNEFIRGCHLGIFPSYYEPWGYTPLECLASGLPSITSEVAGFGDYVVNNIPDHDEKGMYILLFTFSIPSSVGLIVPSVFFIHQINSSSLFTLNRILCPFSFRMYSGL